MKKLLSVLLAAAALSLFSAMAFAQSDEPEKMDMLAGFDEIESLSEEERAEAIHEIAERNMREKMKKEGYTEVAPATAASLLEDGKAEVDPETLALAYSDLESALPEDRQKILDARWDVAYSMSGWYEDGDGAYIVSVDENTKEWYELPKWSELFPDWEPLEAPEEEANEAGLSAALEANGLALETGAEVGAKAGGYHSTVIGSFPAY